MFLFLESRFQNVKQALHTAVPERLLSREAERTSIRSFLEEKVLQRVPGSLYISGAPGTGKTACLNCVLQEMKVLMVPYFSFKDGDGCCCYLVFVNVPSGRAVIGTDSGGELYESTELPCHLSSAGREAEGTRRTEWTAEVPVGLGPRCVSNPDAGG